ncbi:hypothetical protein [Methylobacterium oxalidis]|uniref:Uncharacterized protein n=1 Tax=Methylobacterium oxalidis TaxID=944322 RepID=A0A512IY12_9HYPH|nr:hypothetical protein [Methylobacterium oxalidis]GEP02610.1 hypothetical protein MOX02_06480 [Methylobacterium oxalidis]GJE30058.1 hypothetical protein LDDCCGHA_0221 [Methylobacterium oxalidis]GLS61819.1 hypothetical protein GCM10007888_02000 [Methylobacterium oxalidis]
MADAARRIRDGGGSDVVRRLIARPIRLDVARLASSPVPPPAADDAPEEDADLARLRAEMTVMKAVLEAERRETAKLRETVHRVAGPEPVGDEARAVRDRWATLVDGLLNAPR